MNAKNYIDNKLNESSWSRIIQHIQGINNFAVISAYQKELSDEENLKLHYEIADILKQKYGYIEQKSGYTYKNDEGKELIGKEKSYFIPKIDYETAMDLAVKYNQESFLYKDKDKFALIYSKDGNGFKKGDIGLIFKSNKDKEGNITFNPDVLKIAYSALIKANKSQQGKPFAYVVESIEEAIIPSRTEVCTGTCRELKWKSIY